MIGILVDGDAAPGKSWSAAQSREERLQQQQAATSYNLQLVGLGRVVTAAANMIHPFPQ